MTERPGTATEAFQKLAGDQTSSSVESLSEPTDRTGHLPAYVVLLRTSDNRTRRQVYLSLHGAEKALSRAAARGYDAELVLCRLEPVATPTAEPLIKDHADTVAEQLRRRREASLRLPPLADGHRDPLDARPGGAL